MRAGGWARHRPAVEQEVESSEGINKNVRSNRMFRRSRTETHWVRGPSLEPSDNGLNHVLQAGSAGSPCSPSPDRRFSGENGEFLRMWLCV